MATVKPPADLEKVRARAVDLRTGYPRSATEPLADYAIAARALDKCRAELVGLQGEYHYDCPLTHLFTDYAGIDPGELRDFVASGADDAAVAQWIRDHAKQKERLTVLRWSEGIRDQKLSDLDDDLLTYMEDYIAENLPSVSRHRIHRWFDVYDIEEKRIPV